MRKIVVLIVLCFLFMPNILASKTEIYSIECIDGDTIRAKVDGETETIRFLAINTPETKYSTKDKDEPYAVEASEYTCSRLKEGKTIELEYDKKSNKTDKYGRLLAWIYVDGSLLQKELISNGYAKVDYIYDKYAYVNELKEAESKAKEDKLAIWKEEIEEKEETKEEVEEKEETKEEVEENIMDKIIDYIWEGIKILFKRIIENIKNYLKNVL